MIKKITEFLYENNIKKINEIIDEVNALRTNTAQNIESVIQQYINPLVSSVETGTADGTISVKTGETKTDVAVKGLQSAAYRSEDYFATNSHQHVSNEINKMTGYAKPSVTSAIAASDTLNAAIGKLEKALDEKQASGSYALLAHNQASDTVNAMTGYSKASSVAAISSSDSLNTAIGKLEKGLDGLSNKVDQSSIGNEANKIPRYSTEGHLILPSGIELF